MFNGVKGFNGVLRVFFGFFNIGVSEGWFAWRLAAGTLGGAVRVESGATLTVSSTVFLNNTAVRLCPTSCFHPPSWARQPCCTQGRAQAAAGAAACLAQARLGCSPVHPPAAAAAPQKGRMPQLALPSTRACHAPVRPAKARRTLPTFYLCWP